MTLSPRQFFHSSTANLTPGKDKLLPLNHPDNPRDDAYGFNEGGGWYGEHDRGDKTFAASTESEAEMWKGRGGGYGRDTTYVVDPGTDDYETEDRHNLTGGYFDEEWGATDEQGQDIFHIKHRGTMDITDRIDIPRPNHPRQVVQGTLPPENWSRFYNHSGNNRTAQGDRIPNPGTPDMWDSNAHRRGTEEERMLREADEDKAAAETAHRLRKQVPGQQRLGDFHLPLRWDESS